jgi:hypothetical protein
MQIAAPAEGRSNLVREALRLVELIVFGPEDEGVEAEQRPSSKRPPESGSSEAACFAITVGNRVGGSLHRERS